MAEEIKDVKNEKEVTSTSDTSGKDEKKVETVPYTRFKEVNDEKNKLKEKADLLDNLWLDKDFQEWLDAKEKGKSTPLKGKSADEDEDEDEDKPLTRRELKQLAKQYVAEELKPVSKKMDDADVQASLKEVEAMEKDDEKFPYLKPWGASEDTDKIRKEMMTLLETGEAKTIKGAYKLATYDLALTKTKSDADKRLKELKDQPYAKLRSSRMLGKGEKTFKTVREAAEEAAEKVGF
jgi:hypothetical protein